MRAGTEKRIKLAAAALAVCLCFCLACLCACEEPPVADLTDLAANSYEVEITDTEEYRLYMPKATGVTCGFIFYLGTAMNTDNYDVILSAISAAGVAVYVSSNPFPDLLYEERENAYSILNAEKYFIGGHSQGGGAAVRRACENAQTTAGAILLSPLISNDFTLADKDLPTLYFEAENDYVLSSSMQAAAKGRMNESCEFITLRGAGHMCYGASDLLDGGGTIRDKAEIQREVSAAILAFMQRVIDASASAGAPV